MNASTAKKPVKTKSIPLKGRPGSVLWLMGHELRVFWRRGMKNPKSGLIIAGLLLTFWTGISFVLFMRIGPAIPPPPFNDGPGAGFALAGVSLVIAFIASVIVSSSIVAAVEAIYTRNDLDLLLSSPLSPWRILIVRSSAVAIGALPLYAGLLGPPLLWLAVFSSPLWLSAIVFVITLSFAATGIALLIVNGLFRLIGPKSTRILAQILSAVAGAAVFLSFQYFNIAGRGGNGMTPEQAAELVNQLNIDPHVWWLFPARAMTGDLPATMLWILAAAIIFPFGVFIFSRSFVKDAAAAASMGQKKKVMDGRVAAVRGGVMRSVVRKEFRLLVRDPVLLSQIGLQLVYFLPLAFPLLNPESRLLTEAAFAPALTLLSSALSGSLIWITVSAEDAPDLIASAPVLTRSIDRGKLIAAIAPVLTLMAVPLIALLIRNTYVGLWAVAGVIAASTSSSLIGLWRRKPGNRREFVRRRSGGSVLTMLGQSFVALGLSATAGLGAYGLPWLALIPGIIAFSILGVLHKPAPPAMALA